MVHPDEKNAADMDLDPILIRNGFEVASERNDHKLVVQNNLDFLHADSSC